MTIVNEDLKFRKRLCDFALKNGVTKAAIRYKTNRQFIYRQLTRYNGTAESLRLKSRRPHSHPNQHSEKEVQLIISTSRRYRQDGKAEIYVQLIKRGYTRSYGSMCVQLRKLNQKVPTKELNTRNSRPYKEIKGEYPGHKVQVDIKYVPHQCLKFDSRGIRYYQITAIDEYSRKRIIKIVDEKNVNHTSDFVLSLEHEMGFKIHTIQTDNGSEFIVVNTNSSIKSLFIKTLENLGIEHKRTQPYSPWQNGKVERSHRTDNVRFYAKAEFSSYDDLKRKAKRYITRYNNIHTKTLGFKSPNIIVEEWFRKNKEITLAI